MSLISATAPYKIKSDISDKRIKDQFEETYANADAMHVFTSL